MDCHRARDFNQCGLNITCQCHVRVDFAILYSSNFPGFVGHQPMRQC